MNDLKNIVKRYLPEKFVLLDLVANERSGYIRITIDSEDNVTLNDTSALTKAILNAEEIDPLYPSGYRLEITSPGVDFPLSFPFFLASGKGSRAQIASWALSAAGSAG